MNRIYREPSNAANQVYDAIIVGGGIYGVMLSLEIAALGLRPLLLEKDDFGGSTSLNSLRIVHGGFRYLQSLDLHRFFESVGERRWFLQNFPQLVKPLPCLMPLYGEGLRQPPILRIAMWLNDLLSLHRNRNIIVENHLPRGKIIARDQVKELFPLVDTEDLQGAAVWYDACMPNSEKLLIEILCWACSLGATALNYVEVKQLLTEDHRVGGVIARDSEAERHYEFKAPVVINAAGPWCREVGTQFDRDLPELFKPSLAWNVLFDRPAPTDFALAVTPKKLGGQTYFLHPWQGRLLAGTIHNSWTEEISATPMPDREQIEDFIRDLNYAIPQLKLNSNEILRVFSGLLPATETGGTELAKRETIIDCGKQGGVKGLYAVSGVKFTTSRLVAAKTIEIIFPQAKKFPKPKIRSEAILLSEAVYPHSRGSHKGTMSFRTGLSPNTTSRGIFDYDWNLQIDNSNWQSELRSIIAEESVLHLDDLILRRTSIGDNPPRALNIAPIICDLFDWSDRQRQQELSRLATYFINRGFKVNHQFFSNKYMRKV